MCGSGAPSMSHAVNTMPKTLPLSGNMCPLSSRVTKVNLKMRLNERDECKSVETREIKGQGLHSVAFILSGDYTHPNGAQNGHINLHSVY